MAPAFPAGFRAADPSPVAAARQRPLGASVAPFAVYLVAMHNRIHPVFGEEFLAMLDRLPAGNGMSRPELTARIEIVLSADGVIERLTVINSSGAPLFDIGVLDSIRRAAPFGAVPESIRSTDGNLYVRWRFFRNEMSCSTVFAEPFLLDIPTALSR